MNWQAFASRLYYGSCCLVLFFVAASASFNGFYDKWRLRDIDPDGKEKGPFQFESVVDGSASRPFVYRQLLATIANWIDARTPEQVKDRLFAEIVGQRTPVLTHPLDSIVLENRAYFLRYLILYFGTFFFAWLAVWMMFLLCRTLGYAPPTAALSALTIILLIPYFMSRGGYYYDYPELAFIMLAVWMALKFDWWWLIPVVALATWNKESFLMFTPALYPLLRQRSSRISALAGNGVFASISAAVYLAIRWHFQHNPGGTGEVHFIDQFRYLGSMSDMFATEWTYGVLMLRGFNPLSIVLTGVLVWRGWRSLPRIMRSYTKIAAAINIPLYLLLGFPGEVRTLSMLYVTLLVLVASSLTEWAGIGWALPSDSDPAKAQIGLDIASKVG